ncbi:MAG: hypothetical protein Q7V05_05295 [Methanoregula sp.]|jgi:hypothetical protein|nr:hypothetical protein [Methanoregula sp.]
MCQTLNKEEYDHTAVIGKFYERGLLPFGGGVDSHGVIVSAISTEEHEERMKRLRSIR